MPSLKKERIIGKNNKERAYKDATHTAGRSIHRQHRIQTIESLVASNSTPLHSISQHLLLLLLVSPLQKSSGQFNNYNDNKY